MILLAVSAGRISTTQQVSVATDPVSFDEAIQVAADEKAASRFLDAYTLQTRAGWGNGPLLGRFSTPFSRVVQAAVAARKKGNPFSTADIAPELVAAELHVIALSHSAASDSASIANVQSVVVSARATKDAADFVRPLKTMEMTQQYQDVNGTAFAGPGVVVIFPLTALRPNAEIRVVFDRIVRGSSAMATCRECVIPINLARIR